MSDQAVINTQKIFNTALGKTIEALNHYKVPINKYLDDIKHDFTLRGRRAGSFSYRVNYVRSQQEFILKWNMEAMTKYPDDYLKTTVPHEVAHLINKILALEGKCSYDHHGRNWRVIMRFFGADSRRCHSYQLTPGRRTVKYQETCQCGTTMTFGPKVKANIHHYSCRWCKTKIDPNGITRKQ
jgi:SprT protein